jgi:hypothetical protein
MEKILAKSKYRKGDKFGALTILEVFRFAGDRKGKTWCSTKCECGKVSDHQLGSVVRGAAASCGCRGKPNISVNKREWRIWWNIQERCYLSCHQSFKDYGGRGIEMCKEWKDSFEAFFRDMGKAPSEKHSINRINNDGNYCKENCRWATPKEQGRNKRNNKRINFLGKDVCISEVVEEFKVPRARVCGRLDGGWSPLEAICVPKGSTRRTPTAMEMLEALL